MHANRIVLILLFLFSVASLAIILTPAVAPPSPPAADVPQPVDTAQQGAAAADRQPVAIAAYAAEPGQCFDYRLDLGLGFVLEARGQEQSVGAANVEMFDAHLVGRLSITVLDRDRDLLLVRLQATGLDIQCRHAAQAEVWRDEIGAALARGFDVRMRADGRPLAMRFGDGWEDRQRAFARELIDALRFELDPASTWQREYDDHKGRHVSGYRREGSVETVTVHRSRTAFTPRANDANADVLRSGGASCAFVPGSSWWQRVDLDEGLSWSWLSGAVRVQTWLRGELVCIGQRRVDVAADWSGFEDLGQLPTAKVVDDPLRAMWRERLQGRSVDDLVGELQALLATGSNRTREYHELMQMLAELLRLEPKEAIRLAQQIENAAIAGQQAADLLSVIGMAGHADAQAALAGVFENALVEIGLRRAAVEAMCQLEHATPDLVDSLQRGLQQDDALDPLDGSTMLALGALSGRGATSSDGGAPIRQLVSLESAARRDGMLGAFVEALGNSGEPAVVPVAQRLFLSADPDERGRALTIVRRADDPAVRELLTTALASDPDPDVRRQAAMVLGEARAAWARDLLLAHGIGDADVDVRRVALRALARGPLDLAQQALLVERQSREPDAELRERIASILQRS